MNYSQPLPADKGLLGGHCNRTACLAPDATWWNRITNAYYCQACAIMLNDVAIRLDGQEPYCLPKRPESN